MPRQLILVRVISRQFLKYCFLPSYTSSTVRVIRAAWQHNLCHPRERERDVNCKVWLWCEGAPELNVNTRARNHITVKMVSGLRVVMLMVVMVSDGESKSEYMVTKRYYYYYYYPPVVVCVAYVPKDNEIYLKLYLTILLSRQLVTVLVLHTTSTWLNLSTSIPPPPQHPRNTYLLASTSTLHLTSLTGASGCYFFMWLRFTIFSK